MSDVLQQAQPRDKRALSPRRRARATSDVTGGICRLIGAVGRRVAAEDTESLHELKMINAALDDAWTVAVAGLRRNYSDREIGEMLGMTRQAVWQRWRRPSEASA